MDDYKKYMYKLRELSLKEPYIILKDDIVPKLKHYIQMLNNIKFEDGSYHLYYGEIKTIVNSFNIHWTDVMDEAIKEADRCSNCTNLDELLKMGDKTIFMHQVKQADFKGQFLPAKTALEEQIYNETLEKYKEFMGRLQNMVDNLKKLDKQEKVDAFAKEHFAFSLKKKNDVFVFTYNYISYDISLIVDRIKISIEEIFNRLRLNVRAMQDQSDQNVSNLLLQLYEKNKEHLILSRQDLRSSVELAEVQRSMEIIKDRIEDSKHVPMQRLQEEFKYWEDRLREFGQIEKSMKWLQEAENRVMEQEKLFYSMKNAVLPPKGKCWETMGDKFKEKYQEIQELKLNAAKALHTFFSVRGPDRVFYTDHIGQYYVDEFGHQCYVLDYGLTVYHLNCEGDFVEVPDKDVYYYDEMGRFYTDKGNPEKKLYQIAPCSSSYKLENDVFVKTTKDCGHSDFGNKECRMLIKDPASVVILPKIPPVHIKGTQQPEVVKYLWDTFGHILPDVLDEVAQTSPKNPIHCLAHKLLAHKYKRTEEQNDLKKQEADAYRTKIYQDRIEKASASYKAWKKKQTKPRKTDQLDDHEEKSAYNAQVAEQDFVRSLENYSI